MSSTAAPINFLIRFLMTMLLGNQISFVICEEPNRSTTNGSFQPSVAVSPENPWSVMGAGRHGKFNPTYMSDASPSASPTPPPQLVGTTIRQATKRWKVPIQNGPSIPITNKSEVFEFPPVPRPEYSTIYYSLDDKRKLEKIEMKKHDRVPSNNQQKMEADRTRKFLNYNLRNT